MPRQPPEDLYSDSPNKSDLLSTLDANDLQTNKFSAKNNYYTLFGVAVDSSERDIKKAYRGLSLIYHPDKNPDSQQKAEAIFKVIGAIYEVLGNGVKKREYDLLFQSSNPSVFLSISSPPIPAEPAPRPHVFSSAPDRSGAPPANSSPVEDYNKIYNDLYSKFFSKISQGQDIVISSEDVNSVAKTKALWSIILIYGQQDSLEKYTNQIKGQSDNEIAAIAPQDLFEIAKIKMSRKDFNLKYFQENFWDKSGFSDLVKKKSNPGSNNLLQLALGAKNQEIVKFLIEENVSLPRERQNYTIEQLICKNDWQELFIDYLQEPALYWKAQSPSAGISASNTPTEELIINKLLEKKSRHPSAVELAIANSSGIFSSIVQFFKDKGKTDQLKKHIQDNLNQILMNACEEGNVESIKSLLTKDVIFSSDDELQQLKDEFFKVKADPEESPLRKALTEFGNEELIKFLYSNDGLGIKPQNDCAVGEGVGIIYSSFGHACKGGIVRNAEALLSTLREEEKTKILNQKSGDTGFEATPLQISLNFGKVTMAEYLADQGANIDIEGLKQYQQGLQGGDGIIKKNRSNILDNLKYHTIFNYVNDQGDRNINSDQNQDLQQFIRAVDDQLENPQPSSSYRGIGVEVKVAEGEGGGLKITKIFSPEIRRFKDSNNNELDLAVDSIITEVFDDENNRFLKIAEILKESESGKIIASLFHKNGLVKFKCGSDEYICDNRQNQTSIFSPKEVGDDNKFKALSEIIKEDKKLAKKIIDEDKEKGKLNPDIVPNSASSLSEVSEERVGIGRCFK